jgi:hypothetical protein
MNSDTTAYSPQSYEELSDDNFVCISPAAAQALEEEEKENDVALANRIIIGFMNTPVINPVTSVLERKPWLDSFNSAEFGKRRSKCRVNMYDSTSLERFDADFGLTKATRDMYYIDLFHQYRYFNPRSSPNRPHPVVLHVAWDKFITEFQRNPSAWRDGFLRRTQNYYNHSLSGAMINAHRLCASSKIPCVVRGKYDCIMCAKKDTRPLPEPLPDKIEDAMDCVIRQYAKTKPLRVLNQTSSYVNTPDDSVKEMISKFMMKERLEQLELKKQLYQLMYTVSDLEGKMVKMEYTNVKLEGRMKEMERELSTKRNLEMKDESKSPHKKDKRV